MRRLRVRCVPDLRRSTGGTDISALAINILNENPTLVALGKLTHTNPRATHELTNPQTSLAHPSAAIPIPHPVHKPTNL